MLLLGFLVSFLEEVVEAYIGEESLDSCAIFFLTLGDLDMGGDSAILTCAFFHGSVAGNANVGIR